MLRFGEMSELAIDLAEHICRELHKAHEEILDGDEVGWLGKMFELEINLRHGNISHKRYREEILLIRRKREEHEENLPWM
jgi:hypothetical protein